MWKFKCYCILYEDLGNKKHQETGFNTSTVLLHFPVIMNAIMVTWGEYRQITTVKYLLVSNLTPPK